MNKRLIPLRILKIQLMDGMYRLGSVMLIFTLIFFCIGEVYPPKDGNYMSWFIVNHFVTGIYFLALMLSGRLRKGRQGLPLMLLFLLISLVSAYSLNRVIPVFATHPLWFKLTLICCGVNYLLFAYQRILPIPVRWLQFFILGMAFCCFLYLAIYVLPVTGYGLIAFFFFGISLHAMVPLLFCIYTIVLWRKSRRGRHFYDTGFFSGIGTVVLIVAIYSLIWRVNVVEIGKLYANEDNKNGLPGWVNLLKNIPTGPIANQVLVGRAAYAMPDRWDDGPSLNRWSVRNLLHDPLVMTAAFLAGTVDVPWDERAHVLEALSAYKYDDELHLWDDKDLKTTHVQTVAHIWPALRLAYSEKTLNIRNKNSDWENRQEAIYKFQLPEGAFVSSLSLWINGKEEKSILTTKAKADSAYTEIVGVQQRDPSVVHWREGNSVAVRVFPVFGGEERQFKIGITSPLSMEHGKQTYRNIGFEGPQADDARERIDISFETAPADLNYSNMLHKEKGNRLTTTGEYREDWELSFHDEGLKHQVFSNNGTLYTAVPYRKELGNAAVTTIYPDVNSAWSTTEWNALLAMSRQYHVKVCVDGKFVDVTTNNQEQLFDQLSADRFSIFPFHLIQDAATSLVVTKSVGKSPCIADLEHSSLLVYLKQWLGEGHQIMLYNLGGELSPYLRTLKECRTFRYEKGDAAGLRTLLEAHQFPLNIENDQRIIIESAKMAILANSGTGSSTAPDHLQRLFAYNHIMHAMGSHLLTGGEPADTLVAEAKAAHIVTPLSSLIVLETQQDYARFDIKESSNSLKNASMKNNGAVPEPHEWLLIIGGILLIIWLKYRPALFKRFA